VTDFIRSRPLLSGIVALLLVFILFSAFPIIPETKQAVVVQFGKPARILGSTRAGLSYRIPFYENIVWIDKRVQSVDMDRQQVLSTDQRRLEVDAFARYRIVNPLLMYIRARDETLLQSALVPILG
jgi:membrane protease subunit HflC